MGQPSKQECDGISSDQTEVPFDDYDPMEGFRMSVASNLFENAMEEVIGRYAEFDEETVRELAERAVASADILVSALET